MASAVPARSWTAGALGAVLALSAPSQRPQHAPSGTGALLAHYQRTLGTLLALPARSCALPAVLAHSR